MPEAIKKDKAEEKKEENGLGLSPTVYGIGKSAEHALIVTGVVAALTAGVLYFFKDKDVTADKKVIDLVKWPEIKFRKKIEQLGVFISENVFQNKLGDTTGAGAILKVSLVFAFIVSHFAQIPGYFLGVWKTRKAIEKYDVALAKIATQDHRIKELEAQSAPYGGNPVPLEMQPQRPPGNAGVVNAQHQQETPEQHKMKAAPHAAVPRQTQKPFAGSPTTLLEKARPSDPAVSGITH